MELAKNNPKQNLTPLELQIMQILWQDGPATVNEVRPKLKAALAYTTVQTMLNVLLRKGKVNRVQEGRAFRYRAVVNRKRATGSAVEDLVRRMFGGSPEALLMTMVESRQIGPKELERLNQMIAAAEKNSPENS